MTAFVVGLVFLVWWSFMGYFSVVNVVREERSLANVPSRETCMMIVFLWPWWALATRARRKGMEESGA